MNELDNSNVYIRSEFYKSLKHEFYCYELILAVVLEGKIHEIPE